MRERAGVLETAEAFQVRPQATFSCSKRSLRVSDLFPCRFFTQVAPKCKLTQDTSSMLMRSYAFALYLSNNAIKRYAGYANEKVSVEKIIRVFFSYHSSRFQAQRQMVLITGSLQIERRKVKVKMIKLLCFFFYFLTRFYANNLN